MSLKDEILGMAKYKGVKPEELSNLIGCSKNNFYYLLRNEVMKVPEYKKIRAHLGYPVQNKLQLS